MAGEGTGSHPGTRCDWGGAEIIAGPLRGYPPEQIALALVTSLGTERSKCSQKPVGSIAVCSSLKWTDRGPLRGRHLWRLMRAQLWPLPDHTELPSGSRLPPARSGSQAPDCCRHLLAGHGDYTYQQSSYPEQGYDRSFEESTQHYYEGGEERHGGVGSGQELRRHSGGRTL